MEGGGEVLLTRCIQAVAGGESQVQKGALLWREQLLQMSQRRERERAEEAEIWEVGRPRTRPYMAGGHGKGFFCHLPPVSWAAEAGLNRQTL